MRCNAYEPICISSYVARRIYWYKYRVFRTYSSHSASAIRKYFENRFDIISFIKRNTILSVYLE